MQERWPKFPIIKVLLCSPKANMKWKKPGHLDCRPYKQLCEQHPATANLEFVTPLACLRPRNTVYVSFAGIQGLVALYRICVSFQQGPVCGRPGGAVVACLVDDADAVLECHLQTPQVGSCSRCQPFWGNPGLCLDSEITLINHVYTLRVETRAAGSFHFLFSLSWLDGMRKALLFNLSKFLQQWIWVAVPLKTDTPA